MHPNTCTHMYAHTHTCTHTFIINLTSQKKYVAHDFQLAMSSAVFTFHCKFHIISEFHKLHCVPQTCNFSKFMATVSEDSSWLTWCFILVTKEENENNGRACGTYLLPQGCEQGLGPNWILK